MMKKLSDLEHLRSDRRQCTPHFPATSVKRYKWNIFTTPFKIIVYHLLVCSARALLPRTCVRCTRRNISRSSGVDLSILFHFTFKISSIYVCCPQVFPASASQKGLRTGAVFREWNTKGEYICSTIRTFFILGWCWAYISLFCFPSSSHRSCRVPASGFWGPVCLHLSFFSMYHRELLSTGIFEISFAGVRRASFFRLFSFFLSFFFRYSVIYLFSSSASARY